MIKKYASSVVMLAMIVSVIACGPSGAALVTPTAAGATTQPASGEPAATSTTAPGNPTATSAPGVTAQAGATATAEPDRITFAPGAISATVSDSIAAHGTNQYILNIGANQLLDVALSSREGLHTSIYGVDGTVLQSGMGEAVGFRGTVPTTQDYIIQVSAADQAVDYTMSITIPQRITFEPGATSAVLEGSVPASGSMLYVVNVEAGQFVEISASAAEDLHLSFYGVNGDALKGGTVGGAFYRGTVSTSQDYLISLTSQTAQDFLMSVLIPQRITFAAGATSASLDGSLEAHDSITFVVSAQAGQELQVIFTPTNSAKMSIYGVDGSVMWSGMGEGTSFTGTLTITEDYFITFQTGDQPVDYHLEVVIK